MTGFILDGVLVSCKCGVKYSGGLRICPECKTWWHKGGTNLIHASSMLAKF